MQNKLKIPPKWIKITKQLNLLKTNIIHIKKTIKNVKKIWILLNKIGNLYYIFRTNIAFYSNNVKNCN